MDEWPQDFAPIVDPVGAATPTVTTTEQIAVEVPVGSGADQILRAVADSGRWLDAEAMAELRRMAGAVAPPKKAGAKKSQRTREMIEAIARMSLWEPKPSQSKMAALLHEDYESFAHTCRRYRREIEFAKVRLRPGSQPPVVIPHK